MKHLKNILSITMMLVSLLTSFTASAQKNTWDDPSYNPHHPVVETFTIDPYTINDKLGDTGHLKLYEDLGYVVIPPSYYKTTRGNSVGIVVVHCQTENYAALELRCPNCYYEDDKTYKMRVWTLLSAICDHCKAEAENIILYGSGQITGYKQSGFSPVYMDLYVVEEKRDKNNKKYLEISTPVYAYP